MSTPKSNGVLGLLTPRKLIIQLAGFAAGAALLAWCISGAVQKGDWSRLADADWRLVAALMACTFVSLVVNGTAFWVLIRPVRRLGWWDLQRLNFCCNMLNYLPVRAGAIARMVFHIRVDRMTLLQVGAWIAVLSYVLLLVVFAIGIATVVRPELDWIWAGLVGGQLLLGGLVTRLLVGHRLIVRYGQGTDRMLSSHTSLWTAIVLRIADLAAYTGRMAAALAILGLTLELHLIMVLAMVAFVAGLVPFGRVGFREAAVSVVGARLSTIEANAEGFEAFTADPNVWKQLALVESAGEAIVYLPFGAVAFFFWFRHRLREGGPDRDNVGNGDAPEVQANPEDAPEA